MYLINFLMAAGPSGRQALTQLALRQPAVSQSALEKLHFEGGEGE